MKKINCTLTRDEQRALAAIMFDANPCRSGCAFAEMQEKESDCFECKFTEAYHKLIEKFGLLEDDN
jgi:hypothetical protein